MPRQPIDHGDPEATEMTQGNLFDPGGPARAAVASCLRCARPCRRQPGNPAARLLKRTTADGYCVNCAATEFLQSLEVLTYRRRDEKPFDPQCFRLAHVQEQFAAILRAGSSDASPDELDWLEIIANWHLPFPKPKRQRRRKRGE